VTSPHPFRIKAADSGFICIVPAASPSSTREQYKTSLKSLQCKIPKTISLSGTIRRESGDVLRRPQGRAKDLREQFKKCERCQVWMHAAY